MAENTFFDIAPYDNDLQGVADKFNITTLVDYERYCRDNQLWDQMEACYLEDSEVNISWFKGTGKEFVDISRHSPKAKHKLFNTVIWQRGDKALAETMASMFAPRVEVDGTEVDQIAYSKLLYRVEKRDGVWKVKGLECIYERDSIVPVIPSDMKMDKSEFENFRDSYKTLCYMLGVNGKESRQDLAGDDIPESVQKVYEAANEWLMA